MRAHRLVRALGALAVFVGLTTATVLVPAAPASACSCALVSDAEHAQQATAVVVGEAVDLYVPPAKPVMSSLDPVVYTIHVESVLKGQAHEFERVVTAQQEASCGGLGRVTMNDRSVFFLRAARGILDARFDSSLCSGSHPLAGAGDTVFPGAVVARPQPGGSVPDHAAADRALGGAPSSPPTGSTSPTGGSGQTQMSTGRTLLAAVALLAVAGGTAALGAVSGRRRSGRR